MLHWGQQESTVDTRQADLDDDDDKVDKRGTGRGSEKKRKAERGQQDERRLFAPVGRKSAGRVGPSGSRTIWFVLGQSKVHAVKYCM